MRFGSDDPIVFSRLPEFDRVVWRENEIIERNVELAYYSVGKFIVFDYVSYQFI